MEGRENLLLHFEIQSRVPNSVENIKSLLITAAYMAK